MYSFGYSVLHSLHCIVSLSPHFIQFLYSFGFNVQQLWQRQLFDKQESLHEVLSHLYHIGLIAKYSGNQIIGVNKVTNRIEMMWKNELSVLAEISFAVQIIDIIQKNTIIQTIIIATVFVLLSVSCVHSKFNKVSMSIIKD